MLKNRNLLLLNFLLLLTSGCMMIKPGSVKSGKNLYESYFMGNAGVQYFIKPIVFRDKSNSIFETDFTFKYLQNMEDSALMNFSIKDEYKVYKSIDTLLISNSNLTVSLYRHTLLYKEKRSKYYISRFSTKLTQKDLRLLFNDHNWVIRTKQYCFNPSKKTRKNIDKLNSSVFKLFD